MSKIHYRYAYNLQKELIDVNTLDRETTQTFEQYTCISCEKRIVPKLGEIRKKHFAHKEEVTCSKETYLHILGKQVFFNEYNKCLQHGKPFYLVFTRQIFCDSLQSKYGFQCHTGEEIFQFDLTKSFNKIVVEKRVDEFIPDLLLVSEEKNEKIFIEIAVTHLSSEKKLNSSFRVIELTIADESDLSIIINHKLSQNEKLSFYNFNFKDNIKNLCSGSCSHKGFQLGVVFNDGRCLLRPNMTLTHAHNYINKLKNEIQYHKLDKADYGSQEGFFRLIGQAAKKGLKVRNCFICRYHTLNEYRSILWDDDGDKAIFCKFRKIKCTSNEAAVCSYFKVSQEYVEKFS
ncbi:competence protein CoiA family protein [Pontibacter ruber]|uniref:Competence protein CoiA family protein n=1 Tax=Pontibacter ruber TaxID=1343895 RepID=A0ABW5CS05_9BACT|nr:competence protein CoiA family protein [Pontibacter ruber]